MLIVKKIIDRLKFYGFYKYYYNSIFKNYGDNIKWGRDANFLVIPSSIRISCPELISIESNVNFDDGVYLQCHQKGGGISIGEGTRVNSHVHIQAYSKITLKSKVLIAPFCLIHSGKHGTGEDSIVMDQPYVESGEIIIEEGTWLGHGAKILGGASVGRNNTVAAGAIVNKKFLNSGKTLVGIPAREI